MKLKLPTRAAAPAATVPAQVGTPGTRGPKGTKAARTKAKKKKLKKRATEAEAAEATATPTERDPRIRWALFNGGAAAAGHLAIWSVTGDPMAGTDFMARMTISVPELAAAGLTFGGLVAGWKGAGLVQLHRIPGLFGLAARPVAAIGAAMWGQGTAPVVRDAMYAIEPWGTTLAPLLAAGPVAAALWWGLDRRAREAAPLVRWFARVPLATVTVSSLLYAPGVVL
ncbi:hypothetical protein [Streptomyces sp. WAC01280]|uniref:hypothetical protein n=1 Tax=Streptomyces sp. WAC01280 TaxID=2487424 RepID=UPI000F78D54B|nr:hypothetical protein [Streptomyces sp. WAC01280]RSS50079.1 hypothetical protein EF909_39215 [Streptomyces sp. WAC01280]